MAAGAMRLYRIPFSTNVERIALAAAHKGLELDYIDVADDDRSEVVRVSGQELVPVLEHDGLVLADSPAILEYLEQTYPAPPLLPADPAGRAEIRIFCDWFNRVWKRAPNLYFAEGEKAAPDAKRLEELGGRITASLPLFEDLLAGRDFLFGELSLADVTAFPFLKYAVIWEEGDPHRFHEILRDHLRLDGAFPRLEAWLQRVDALPRA
ncbi:MAG: glutathione S-transferase family protein [Gaiellaceae bacterium]